MRTVELRSKPELKISIHQSGFQLLDAADPKNNGDFSYLKLNYVKFYQEQTDWFVSIISFVMDLFTGGGNSDKYKNKANLQFNFDNKIFKVYLIDADLDKAKAISDLLNKKSLHQTT